MKPPKPISTRDVPWVEWSDVPRFALRYRPLTMTGPGEEDYHVGVAIEELAPGKQSSPAHYHIHEEEHVYILAGSVTVRIGDARYEMRTGDYVCFPAGQKAGHCLINNADSTCRYVILGERDPNEVAVYTDSSKVLVRALGRRMILDLAARRQYWDGENTGLPPTEKPPPDAVDAAWDAVAHRPPVSSGDVAWEQMRQGTRFGGQLKRLTYAALGSQDYHVGVRIEAPAPGMRLCPNHYHMLEEEHALILEGEVTLFLSNERYDMRPGDYVCFPAGHKAGHSFMNSGTGPCSYLMIGERNPNEVCVYPDSNKMAVDALREPEGIFDMSGLRKYWDGERTS